MPHLRCSHEAEQFAFDFGEPCRYATAFEDEDGLVMRYGLDDGEINERLGAILPGRLADLLDIAVAIYMSDRLALRGGPSQPDWRRTLAIQIPVRHIELWRRQDVQESLHDVLSSLTQDDWDIRFCQRPTGFRRVAESQQQLFSNHVSGVPLHVSLLSGGLDSFVGTAAAIGREPAQDYVCVSGVPNHRQGERQREQVKILRSLSPRSLTHVRVACWLQDASEVRQEPTRRTRGFLFLALGAAAALTAGTEALWLYENGVGALNLPFADGEIGVSTSRSVHPGTLRRMGALVSLVAGSPFTIRNGSVLQTKAQICADPRLTPVRNGIPRTFSCDAFPLRQRGASQCGVCTSCLLRRMALWNAGLGEYDALGYRYDVCSPALALGVRQARGLSEMDWQVARLASAVGQPDPWRALVNEFPSLVEAQHSLVGHLDLSAAAVAGQLVELYRRHCEEWRRFPGALLAMIRREAA